VCGNYLSRGKNNPDIFYCSNYNGKKNGTPCAFPPSGRNKVAELDAIIAEYKNTGAAANTQPAPARPVAAAETSKERKVLEEQVTILLKTKQVDIQSFWDNYAAGSVLEFTYDQLVDAVAKLKSKPDKAVQQ
jgi:hypothetical protein